jgi:dihydrolipoamide dehydrogenase
VAHVASSEGVLVSERVAGHAVQPLDYAKVPNVTFCHPQVASIGLGERAATERGHKVRVGRFPFQALGKAMILGETDGFVKIVADEKYGEILGIHILHAQAGQMVGEAVAAMYGELPVADLARAIHPHPTLSEAVMEAAHATFGSPLHG